MKILIKAIKPHRQKILTSDGEEMHIQRWANKQAAQAIRGAGGDAAGEQFTQARDKLMRDAVANPEEHGLKFLNERVPFEGQNLESSLSDPMSASDIADITDASSAETERAMGGKTPNLFDSEGKLRDDMPPEEEFNPDAEAEHMKRIMTSRQVPMRNAWSILKNNGYVACPRCGFEDDSEDHKMKIRTAGKCDSCLQDDFRVSMRGQGPTHNEDGFPVNDDGNEYYWDGAY
tara:strand:+ start:708 stop:1403 length:696 start_codon:yes stop_codon:yes gene_type:complete